MERLRLLKAESRQPYGTKEIIHQPKKLFPGVNIHYAHHDSVLPSKDFVKLLEEYHSRKREQAQTFIHPDNKKHFSSEYRLRYDMSDPQFQEQIKYMVPGEFAGKKTFKEQLVNIAPEQPQSQRQYLRQIQNHSEVRYQETPNNFQQYVPSQQAQRDRTPQPENYRKSIESSLRAQQNAPVQEKQPIDYSVDSKRIQSTVMTPRKVIKVQPTQLMNPKEISINQFADVNINTSFIKDNYRSNNAVRSRYQNNQTEVKSIRQELPILKEPLLRSSSINKSLVFDNPPPPSSKFQNVPSFSKLTIGSRNQPQVQVQSLKNDFSIINSSFDRDSPNKVLTEQERYLSRLRSSIERQGIIYQNAQKIILPSTLQSLHQLDQMKVNSQIGTFNNTRNVTQSLAKGGLLNQSLDRYAYNRNQVLPQLNQSIL